MSKMYHPLYEYSVLKYNFHITLLFYKYYEYFTILIQYPLSRKINENFKI